MALFLSLVRGRKWLTAAAAVSCALSAVAALVWNARLAEIIDRVSKGERPAPGSAAAALVIMLATAAFAYMKVYLSGCAAEYIGHDLRVGYASYFASLPAAETESLNTGEQLSKLLNEISGVTGYIGANLFALFDDLIKFIFTLTWLIVINPALTAASNLPVAAVAAYVFFSGKTIGRAAERSQQAKEKMNRYAETLLTLFPVIKLYGASALTRDGYLRAEGEWEERTVRLERTKARLMSLSGILSRLPVTLLFLVGGHMAIRGAITVGTLYIFLNLSGNVSGVFMNMPGQFAAFKQFSVNIGRLGSYFEGGVRAR